MSNTTYYTLLFVVTFCHSFQDTWANLIKASYSSSIRDMSITLCCLIFSTGIFGTDPAWVGIFWHKLVWWNLEISPQWHGNILLVPVFLLDWSQTWWHRDRLWMRNVMYGVVTWCDMVWCAPRTWAVRLSISLPRSIVLIIYFLSNHTLCTDKHHTFYKIND